MYWFGQKVSDDFCWQDDSKWRDLFSKKRELAQIPLDHILDLLDAFSKESFDEALPELIKESGFSKEETQKTLSLLPELLKKENLMRRLRTEFVRPEVLDRFMKLPHGQFKTKATPMGCLLHVTAGNVFLSSIDSLIMGLITKNISLIKVSSQNKFFPVYFAQKLSEFDKKNILADKFCILHWKGGDEGAENFIKHKVNGIIAWGGEEMISSYKKNLPRHVKFLDFGPKVSFQLITQAGLEDKNLDKIAQKIVSDITPWDQGACASPQNLYLQEGVDEAPLLKALERAFKEASPRGDISADEATEILKEAYRGLYSELMEDGFISRGKNFLLHSEKNNILRPSPLNRSLIIKRFKNQEELCEILEPFSYYLQSCSYLLEAKEKDLYLETLSLVGIKRFAPLGTVTWGMEGAPHDGRFVLRELVNFVGDELRSQDDESNLSLRTSQDLKKYFNPSSLSQGYLFSSGGTTGEPKFVHFDYEEFDYMSDMLAKNFEAQGVCAGMVVANLFVAGNLWSSFLCVDKALEKIGAIQLPIGGMCSLDNILYYLERFKPDVVTGIPSMLVTYAEHMIRHKKSFEVPMIFYAGEALSKTREEFLRKAWRTRYFGSAGYASVDAGVIGYQCRECSPGEHHVFSELVDLKISNGEGIVSSLVRSTLPIKNYRTGDRMEWIDECSCGRSDKRFKLLGRMDDVIQIWSCRLLLSDVEASLNRFGIRTFQIKITEDGGEERAEEKMQITYEADAPLETENLILDLYQRSRDVKDTLSLNEFRKGVDLIQGSVPRNTRTGKISLVQDLRR